MKKILLLLLFITVYSQSQSTDFLDKKNGFKSFKLGTSMSTFRQKGILLTQPEYLKNNKDKNVYQVFTQVKMFNYEVDVMWFRFNATNDLVEIILSIDAGKYPDVFTGKLRVLFGTEQNYSISDSGIIQALWRGKKVQLEVSHDPTLDYNPNYQTIVKILSITEYEKELINGF
jgi:hypothetical protein